MAGFLGKLSAVLSAGLTTPTSWPDSYVSYQPSSLHSDPTLKYEKKIDPADEKQSGHPRKI